MSSPHICDLLSMSILSCVKKTVQQMMTSRGYTSPVEKNFENGKCNVETAIWSCSNDVEECYIFFCVESKLGVQEFRKFQVILEENDIGHCIIVSNQGATSFTSSLLQSMDSHELEVELFPHKYLVRNPTLHALYNQQRAVTAEEKSVIMAKYHATGDQIPILYTDDRICQYFNYHVGDVVETTRCYGSVGPYITYRIVQRAK